ncbi:hypothetical protein C9994_10145 [Marivirga lumbricoides]|uniref:Uncharacterized protein n=1 Tax=Marivirga lumbricoides TaxID=1046115 RepID=A0A2T4DPS4_9BACT|nr:hypothetical protein C9994_10145 [Marivirga lumbricoides]
MKMSHMARIFILLLMAWNVSAQSRPPLLDRSLSLHFIRIPLQEALFTISKEADFNLSYNSSIIPSDSVINYHCDKEKLSEILSFILPARVDIKTSGNSVILLRKPEGELKKKTFVITGKVTDSKSKKALDKVTVLDVYGSESTLTDASGNFELRLSYKYKELVLSISKNGYADSSVLLSPKKQELTLQLIKTKSRSNEIPLTKIENIPVKPVEAYPLSKLMIPPLLVTHSKNIQGYTKRKIQLSLTPGLSSNLKIAGTVKNDISINLIGGYNYGVEILEIGGAFNINRTNVNGVQLAGMANLVGESVYGLQISGAFNATKGRQSGTQIAGLGNLNMNNFVGVQLGGGYNQSKNLKGTQIAGAVNIADTLSGLQLSPSFNKSKLLEGVQICSGLNMTETLEGVQIGIINLAKQQKGFQLGLINVNKSSEGISIGLLNFVENRKFPRLGFAIQ